MKIFIVYHTYFNGCDEFNSVERVFANKSDAIAYIDAKVAREDTWYFYNEHEVE